jgi:glycogen phosphorylase
VNIVGRMAVFPTIPARFERLHELAYNLWWTWTPEAQQLYAEIDPDLWERTEHNAVKMLLDVGEQRLKALSVDAGFLAHYDAVLASFDAYLHPKDTWFSRTYPEAADKTIAYFSAEFGLHESLPIYSGGLGILAGDHCKEASDLGVPLVGVGFLYPQGYFRQRITGEGRQQAIYDKLHFSEAPALPAKDPDGREVVIGVELPGRTVYAKVWRIQVGRVPLFLMDTDVEPNAPEDRTLSARLYGGDHEMRIAQEIMLGIGGVRALRALGIDAAVWHMNEGHAAFLGLERCRELVEGLGCEFEVACHIASANAVFTTHTPVAAGNDVFGFDLIDRYFHHFWPRLRLSRDAFFDLARQHVDWGDGFSMTVLALQLSAQHNGVSRLHGEVSRQMWHNLWPDLEESEVSITHITNGVHTATWLAPRLSRLYGQYLGADWYEHLDDFARWLRVHEIPDEELWATHQALKSELIEYARKRLRRQRVRIGEGTVAVAGVERLLDPHALTLGFARRFATYKRATLLFRDPQRLARLLNNPERPVQILFAGKAHPADQPGQELIRQVYEYSRRPEFAGKIVFLEDYDMDMARHLVSGCDVWLNTPIRPHEASGTSGQKASLNGLPNCSIIDGWWEEGFNGRNGWAIGESRAYQNEATRDDADSAALYSMLENEIVPLYYTLGSQGVSPGWITIMKEAIHTVAPAFSMRRMVKEYVDLLYMPALEYGRAVDAEDYALARQLTAWCERVRQGWGDVRISAEGPREGQLAVGQPVQVGAVVQPGKLGPEDLLVQLMVARDEDGALLDRRVIPLELEGKAGEGTYRYRASVEPSSSGSMVYGVRVVPSHPGLAQPLALGLAKWA